ncbi:acetyltransferases [Longilinea arvoryzae]|uniref:Acetyltransferases n=1 Tax=Longilinea arvoryzae TaxID=360412 RepID=A0A0S7BBQ4_9CHLR|nr:GNAT family N-acetyltransferase [Longilinea arvoryzae]GAP12685.1 acetyltransferases [Longilinea arvoryzae]
MYVYDRPFDDERRDFEKMWHFVRADYAARQDHFIWLFSRLGDWKYGLWNDQKCMPTFCRDHAQLWFGPFDELLGFVLSENGDNIFFIFTLPGCDYLYAEILEWTVEHWMPRYGSLKTEVHEHQAGALIALQRRGFHSNGIVATTRAYDIQAVSENPLRLPEGFRILNMCENTDERSKTLLYHNAYHNQDQISEFDLLTTVYSHQNPAYEPAFDFSVVTPEGVHVSSCVGFNDPVHGVAEIEKVCTHSRYRRLGLAEAVIRTCMQRLKARGIRRAYITGYSNEANGLYEKLGPCGCMRWFHYELKPG